MSGDWSRTVPAAWTPPELIPDPYRQAFNARVKAMHHWIRKGNPEKAALATRIVAHTALNALARKP